MSAGECLSSLEASPIKLVGPGFHVHQPVKRARSPALSPGLRLFAAQESTVVELSDDDGVCLSSLSGMHGHGMHDTDSSDCVIQTHWSPRFEMRKRSKPLAYPTTTERIIEPATLLAQLNVVELPTSGYNNNCLWFSVQRATAQLSATRQYTAEAECASDKGRTQIHQELIRALPAAANVEKGENFEWWAGFSRARAELVYAHERMMCEPHIFACANMINRPICVVDTRAHAAVIRVYRPGYAVKGLDVSMVAAQRLHATEPQCVWVRLHGVHFSALVACVESEY